MFYLLDGLHVISEKDANAATKVRYIPGVGQIRDGKVNYYLHDALGSVVALTDADGNVTDRCQYDAWGSLVEKEGATENPYLWCGAWGYYADADTGMYLLGLRWYHPVTVRFITEDPIDFGRAGRNVYRYVRNSPASQNDPLGLASYCEYICFRLGTPPMPAWGCSWMQAHNCETCPPVLVGVIIYNTDAFWITRARMPCPCDQMA